MQKLRLQKEQYSGGELKMGQSLKNKSQIYKFFELLGEGAFCKVYRATYLPTQEELAVKVNYILIDHYSKGHQKRKS